MAVVLFLARVVQWLGSTLSGMFAAGLAAASWHVAAQQAAEAAARLVRVGIVTAVLLAVINSFIPPGTNLFSLWSNHVVQAAPMLAYIGYFVPIGLLFTLLDLLLFATLVMVVFRAVQMYHGFMR